MSEPDTTPVAWRHLADAPAVAAAIVRLYRERGDGRYDEALSQTAHALQSAVLAREEGASDDLVVAAFLHDIGHLLLADGSADVDRHHEAVGSRFLARWFAPAVTEPIASHVVAKRYLCATDAGYLGQLSAGSQRSLELQGGPMTPGECRDAETQQGFADALRLRRWDDRAKQRGAVSPDLDAMEPLIARAVTRLR